MKELFFIKYEDFVNKTERIDSYSDEGFALGGLSDLMAKNNVQVKAVIKVVDGQDVENVIPIFDGKNIYFDTNYKGSIASSEEGPYIMSYTEFEDYKITLLSNEEELKDLFASKQRTSSFELDVAFKLDVDTAVLTPLLFSIENFKYIVKENVSVD